MLALAIHELVQVTCETAVSIGIQALVANFFARTKKLLRMGNDCYI